MKYRNPIETKRRRNNTYQTKKECKTCWIVLIAFILAITSIIYPELIYDITKMFS